MEGQLGENIGDVRIHTDSDADAHSRRLSAQAFTTGSDIYFSRGSYEPGSPAGVRLLTHELIHVLQHKHAPRSANAEITRPHDAAEVEARTLAEAAWEAHDHESGQPSATPAGATVPDSRTARQQLDRGDDFSMVEDVPAFGPLYLLSDWSEIEAKLRADTKRIAGQIASAQESAVLAFAGRERSASSWEPFVESLITGGIGVVGAVYGGPIGVGATVTIAGLNLLSSVPDADDPADTFEEVMIRVYDETRQNVENDASRIVTDFAVQTPPPAHVMTGDQDDVRRHFISVTFPEIANGLTVQRAPVFERTLAELENHWEVTSAFAEGPVVHSFFDFTTGITRARGVEIEGEDRLALCMVRTEVVVPPEGTREAPWRDWRYEFVAWVGNQELEEWVREQTAKQPYGVVTVEPSLVRGLPR